MAAEAMVFVSPLLNPLLEKLSSALWEQLRPLWGLHNDLHKLKRMLSVINDVLGDAERRPVTSEALRGWLSELKDAVYDADDLLDELETHVLLLQRMSKVRHFLSCNNPALFRIRMGRKIKVLMKRMASIAEERIKFHLKEGSASSLEEQRLDWRETYSLVGEAQVLGREDDKALVLDFLLLNHKYYNIDENHLSVLPLVGMGGIGKTKLTQLVFNDEKIEQQFDLCMWVCVSEHFNAKEILRLILESTTKQRSNLSSIESLQSKLQESLNLKRFLLVLDDVWNENESEWERVRTVLACAKQGSKIIVTTRSDMVARIMGTVPAQHLQGLSNDDCWAIFRQIAFGRGRAEESPRLVEIGKEMVKRCKGLPLAVKALGSLLADRKGEAEWLGITNSEIWRSSNCGILPTLKLSYDHLPCDLKQCFVYCSLYPKDYEFEKEELIRLWIAEGFIRSSDENIRLEDVGDQHFSNLLRRCFFQDVQEHWHGTIVKCKMHDLVHDLACSAAQNEFLAFKSSPRVTASSKCRYASIVCEGSPSKDLMVPCEAKKLHSLHIFGRTQGLDKNQLRSMKRLRVLNLRGVRIKELPSILGTLRHLRLLDLSGNEIKKLPESITGLVNLQVLSLRGCCSLEAWPKSIHRMKKLVHLDIRQCYSLAHMPCGLGQLTNLRTLPRFFLGNDHGPTIKELQNLNDLQGQLVIQNLHEVKSPTEAAAANLKTKTHLHTLRLTWAYDATENDQKVEIIEQLEPPPHLKFLSLAGYDGPRFPSWMSSSSPFQQLVELNLDSLHGCRSLPALGEIPSLELLGIRRMDAVKRIGEEFYGVRGAFPSLKELELWVMENLEEWSTIVPGRDVFPVLRKLMIWDCPKLKVSPFFPTSLVHLGIDESNKELLFARSLQGSSNLKTLVVYGCEASSLWKGIQHVTALEELVIQSCEAPTDLWEEDTTSFQQKQSTESYPALQHLEIRKCSGLTRLPEWAGGLSSLRSLNLSECLHLAALPEGLQFLTTLQELTIKSCPQLEQRCREDGGEDWHKIAHIPIIQIIPG